MEETLFPGDFVVLRTGDYQVGDVVSYKPFDDVPAQVIHRILEFKEDGTIVLQGDNNNFIDPFFPTEKEITGKMLFHIPKIGSVAWFLGQPLVWGSLMLIAGAIYLYQPSRSKNVKRRQTAEPLGSTDRDETTAQKERVADSIETVGSVEAEEGEIEEK